MKKILGKLTYANVMATVAVFIALSGAGYAAIKLPKNSVGARQLKRGAVTPAKLSRASRKALTGPAGPRGETGSPGPRGEQGKPGNPGAAAVGLWARVSETGTLEAGSGAKSAERSSTGHYRVEFDRNISQCNAFGSMTFMQGEIDVETGKNDALVETFSSSGSPSDRQLSVSVIC